MTKPNDGRFGLTLQRLRDCLLYDPDTGLFTWLADPSGRRERGEVAGEEKSSGYVLIGLDGHRYRAHRLAWLYVKGEWPADEVDHWNCIRRDNRWVNLRPASNQQNQANSKRPSDNTSGFKGVFWSKQRGKWAAKINPNRKQVHLGFFDDPSAAAQAYIEAAQQYFGRFANAG